jgi:glycosyltransferase involved in cell wall biosynthesis
MKILYVTTIGTTMSFFIPFVRRLLDEGHMVCIACNATEQIKECYREWGCSIFKINCSRSPLNKGNLVAVYELRRIVAENHFDIVHCHTPISAACCRLACRKARQQGTRVIYTAHGFHFYKGAPRKNWLIYYPIEWICSFLTDTLITINQEDNLLAQKHMHAKRVVYVPGVGIDLQKYKNRCIDVVAKRATLGIPAEAIVLLSVGELNENKNHSTSIRAIGGLDVYYMIVGEGERQTQLEQLAEEVGMKNRVKFLGYRTDIQELCLVSDAFVFPSFREGLSVALMEAMASGLPCIVSRIRGNTDLIDENGGALFNPTKVNECKTALSVVLTMDRFAMGRYNQDKVRRFGTESVLPRMQKLYSEVVL